MQENETCQYCSKPANWTVYPEYRVCNHCKYVTYPKRTAQYFYEKATGEKAEDYKLPSGGMTLTIKDVPVHKYVESTGDIIEQGGLTEF